MDSNWRDVQNTKFKIRISSGIILVPGGKAITETNRKYDSNKIITEIMTRHYALGSYDLIGQAKSAKFC